MATAGSAGADVPSDKTAQAEVLFQEGRDLMAKGQLDEACPKLRASHDLDPGYGVLWNLADCLSKQGKTASAWAAFREAADMARRAGQPERVEKAERRATELDGALTKLRITVTSEAPGLTIRRDGLAVDRATWGSALPVDPGRHVIEATAPGKKAWKMDVEAKGPGEVVAVPIPALEDAPAPPSGPIKANAPAPIEEDKGASARRTIGLVVGGAGLAALAAGGVLGGLASSKWSEAQESHCRTDTLCDAEGVSLAGDAKTFAGASTGLFIGGGALAAGGLILFVTALGGKTTTTGLVVTPVVGSTRGVSVAGQF